MQVICTIMDKVIILLGDCAIFYKLNIHNAILFQHVGLSLENKQQQQLCWERYKSITHTYRMYNGHSGFRMY